MNEPKISIPKIVNVRLKTDPSVPVLVPPVNIKEAQTSTYTALLETLEELKNDTWTQGIFVLYDPVTRSTYSRIHFTKDKDFVDILDIIKHRGLADQR
jgi:hypothetical protein